jgi:hypothetical protein
MRPIRASLRPTPLRYRGFARIFTLIALEPLQNLHGRGAGKSNTHTHGFKPISLSRKRRALFSSFSDIWVHRIMVARKSGKRCRAGPVFGLILV